MAKLKEYLVLLFFINVTASEFIQHNGAEITIKVSQEIPKHLCWRFLNNLEVKLTKKKTLLENNFIQYSSVSDKFLLCRVGARDLPPSVPGDGGAAPVHDLQPLHRQHLPGQARRGDPADRRGHHRERSSLRDGGLWSAG